ncbi:MAG: hypothetical protein Q9191_001194 [Dirinaria sp. TL-2023a]
MAMAAMAMLAQWVFGGFFNGAAEVPASVQLRPTLASLYREARGSPAPATLSYQLQLVPGDVRSGGGLSTTDYTCLLFAWLLFLLSVGLCLFACCSQVLQATKASLVQFIKALHETIGTLNETIGTLHRTIEENVSKIAELTKTSDSLLDQANDAKVETRRYETLLYENKAKMDFHMKENLILRSTIFVPVGTFNVDIQFKRDRTSASSTIPSGTISSDADPSDTVSSGTIHSDIVSSGAIPSGTNPSGTIPSDTISSATAAEKLQEDLPQKVQDDLPQHSETVEAAAPKKGRNWRRRQNKRARRPEPDETPVEPDNKNAEDQPRTGLSAWASFQATSDREQAARKQKAAEQLALRKAEEAQTGVRDEPELPDFKETWKQVKVNSGQRRVVGVGKGQEDGGDKPRTGVSAWNSFQATSGREEAARRQQAAQQSALRKAEEARTGVKHEPQLPEFKETWRKVKVDSNQRRVVGVAKDQPSK